MQIRLFLNYTSIYNGLTSIVYPMPFINPKINCNVAAIDSDFLFVHYNLNDKQVWSIFHLLNLQLLLIWFVLNLHESKKLHKGTKDTFVRRHFCAGSCTYFFFNQYSKYLYTSFLFHLLILIYFIIYTVITYPYPLW